MHAFVTAKLDNLNSLLYGLPKTQLSRLQKIQNCAAKIVVNGRKFDHVTPILKKLQTDMLIPKTSPYSTRSTDTINFHIPRTKTSIGSRAFSVAAPKLWNNLPADVKNAQLVETFKVKLKTFLFKKAFTC